jgi:hypothetical protein
VGAAVLWAVWATLKSAAGTATSGTTAPVISKKAKRVMT